jgi:hypothetical protein
MRAIAVTELDRPEKLALVRCKGGPARRRGQIVPAAIMIKHPSAS